MEEIHWNCKTEEIHWRSSCHSKQGCHFPKWKTGYLRQEKIRICFALLYQILRSDITLEVYHKYFVNIDDHTAKAKITVFVGILCQVKTFRRFITDTSSWKAQILFFTTCSADSSYFIPSHLTPFCFHFLVKIRSKLRKHELRLSCFHRYHDNVSVCNYFIYHDTEKDKIIQNYEIMFCHISGACCWRCDRLLMWSKSLQRHKNKLKRH